MRLCPLALVAAALGAVVLVTALRPKPRTAPARLHEARLPFVLPQTAPHARERQEERPAAVTATATTPPLTAMLPTPVDVLRRAAKVYVPDIELPSTFEPSAKSPCWHDASGAPRCLPAFMLLGVYQSGSHDLYARLAKHALVARNPSYSPSFYSEVHPWSDYMSKLSAATRDAIGTEKLIGECSAVTFHFSWVHQEQFNQAYVKSMGAFWKECTGRTLEQKQALPHRECMARHMPEARAAYQAVAAKAGLSTPMLVPQLVRAVYGDEPGRQPALIVLLRLPWARMHAAFYNYVQYGKRYGASVQGESAWAAEAVAAFRRCEANFTTDDCARRFESLSRDNEEVFYHCDQLIKGMYASFLPAWRREHQKILFLRSEDYFAAVKPTLLRTMKFIGLPPPQTEQAWAPLLNARRTLHGQRPAGGAPPMAKPTIEMLREFYKPSMERLVSMLADVPDAEAWRSWARRRWY